MENKERKLVDNVEALENEIARVREAQAKYATYTQEQVDAIFKAAAIAANMARIPLAKMAVEETGMGVVEDKVIKNNYAAEYIYNKYMRRDRRRQRIRHQEGSRAHRRNRGGDTHDKPDLHRYLQDAHLAQDKKRHHNQPSPQSKEIHHCRSKARA